MSTIPEPAGPPNASGRDARSPAPRVPAGVASSLPMLLAVAVFINYVDRGNLATAAPVIKDAFHLSASQLGMLFSAFYWTYAVSQLGAGWLAERFAVHRVIAAGFALWSIATLLTGFASSFAMLLGLRLLLGIGESVAFPCSSKLLAVHVDVEKRGRANGAIAVGLATGPAFGTFVGGLILAHFGWQPLFVSLGALSLLWLWPWLTGPARALSETPAPVRTAGPSYWDIVRRRAALGLALGHFCGNYAFYVVINWLPSYLVLERGFSLTRMAVLGGAVYSAQAVGALLTGWVQDRWVRRGVTLNRVHKSTMVFGQTAIAVSLVGAIWGTPVVSIVCLLFAGFSFGLGTTTLYAAGQALAGPRAAGRWIGFQNFVGNLAGIVSAWITGLLKDRTGHFSSAFGLTVVIVLLGLVTWMVIIPEITEVDWTPVPRRRLAVLGAEA